MAFSVLLLLLTFGFGIIVAWRWKATHVSSRDIAWIADSAVVPPAEAAVYSTYLSRVRRYRFVGGLVGILFAIIVGVRYYASVNIGIGKNSPLSDVLFCGLAGVLIGSDTAEHFRLREPKSSTVAASLAERGVKVDHRIINIARGLTGATVVIGAIALATGHGATLLGVALGGVALQVVTEQTRQAVIGRRRLVLSPAAHEVDLRIRTVACRSATWSQLAAAVLMAGWMIAKLPILSRDPYVSDLLGLLQSICVLSCLVETIILLVRAKPGPSRAWTPTHSGTRTAAGTA